jgi:cyclic pyranopterin phosphate synthase
MKPLIDPFGRAITYLRVSVTDRCDLRCIYCMSERMRFLPRNELLSIEELDRLCTAFIERGVRRLRFTGGEPLVRRGFIDLLQSVKRHLGAGLDEITITTNGVQLAGLLRAQQVSRSPSSPCPSSKRACGASMSRSIHSTVTISSTSHAAIAWSRS